MGMRRDATLSSSGYSLPLGPARLDLDDLKDLRLLLADRSTGPVQLYAGDRIAENGIEDDLQEDVPDDCLKTVRFATNGPQVVVYLYGENARATYLGGSFEGRELVEDVGRYVQQRRTRVAPIYRQSLIAGIVLALAVAIFQIVVFIVPVDPELRFAGIYFCPIPLLLIGMALGVSPKIPSVVVTLERRDDRRHLTKQLKREVFLVVVGALGG